MWALTLTLLWLVRSSSSGAVTITQAAPVPFTPGMTAPQQHALHSSRVALAARSIDQQVSEELMPRNPSGFPPPAWDKAFWETVNKSREDFSSFIPSVTLHQSSESTTPSTYAARQQSSESTTSRTFKTRRSKSRKYTDTPEELDDADKVSKLWLTQLQGDSLEKDLSTRQWLARERASAQAQEFDPDAEARLMLAKLDATLASSSTSPPKKSKSKKSKKQGKTAGNSSTSTTPPPAPSSPDPWDGFPSIRDSPPPPDYSNFPHIYDK